MSKPSLSASSVSVNAVPANPVPVKAASTNSTKPRRMTAEQMRNDLQQMFRQNPETSFLRQLREPFRDPIKEGKDGRFRINPIWVQIGILAGLTLATFLYFTYAR